MMITAIINSLKAYLAGDNDQMPDISDFTIPVSKYFDIMSYSRHMPTTLRLTDRYASAHLVILNYLHMTLGNLRAYEEVQVANPCTGWGGGFSGENTNLRPKCR